MAWALFAGQSESGIRLPWEPPPGVALPNGGRAPDPLAILGPPPPVPSSAPAASAGQVEGGNSPPVKRLRSVLPTVARRRPGPTPGERDAAERQAAVRKWVAILGAVADGGDLAEGSSRWGSDAARWALVEETLAIKATSNLHKRAGSMAMYIKWCGEQGHRPFPLNAEAVHQYLRYCNGRAHTRGQAFLEAAAFLCHYFRVPTGEALDPQASGIAFQGLEAKPPPNKRREVPKSIVAAWERKTVLAARAGTPLARDVVRGFLLFLLHARFRGGDGTRLRAEPTVEGEHGFSFIECRAFFGEHKTGRRKKALSHILPVVGLGEGVTGLAWAEAWLRLRAAVGLDAAQDGCLMPGVLTDGCFSTSRMATDEVAGWVRVLAREEGASDDLVALMGSHSLKATLLAWAAKAGMDMQHRRLLGYHAAPGERTPLEYSRDAMAAPLRALRDIVDCVRDGSFDPEATRSGRWARAAGSCCGCGGDRPGFLLAECASCQRLAHSGPPCLGPCDACGLQLCPGCRRREDHGCLGTPPGAVSTDVDTEEAEGDDEEEGAAAAEEQMQALGPGARAAAAGPAAEPADLAAALPLLRHRRTRVVHVESSTPFIAECGIELTETTAERLCSWPGAPFHACCRPGCGGAGSA